MHHLLVKFSVAVLVFLAILYWAKQQREDELHRLPERAAAQLGISH